MSLIIAIGAFLTVALVLAVDVLWPQPSQSKATPEPEREAEPVLSRR